MEEKKKKYHPSPSPQPTHTFFLDNRGGHNPSNSAIQINSSKFFGFLAWEEPRKIFLGSSSNPDFGFEEEPNNHCRQISATVVVIFFFNILFKILDVPKVHIILSTYTSKKTDRSPFQLFGFNVRI